MLTCGSTSRRRTQRPAWIPGCCATWAAHAMAMLRGPVVMVDGMRNTVYEARKLLGEQASPEPGRGLGRGKLDYRLYAIQCMHASAGIRSEQRRRHAVMVQTCQKHAVMPSVAAVCKNHWTNFTMAALVAAPSLVHRMCIKPFICTSSLPPCDKGPGVGTCLSLPTLL